VIRSLTPPQAAGNALAYAVQEAIEAGWVLLKEKYVFDIVYTSVLRRVM